MFYYRVEKETESYRRVEGCREMVSRCINEASKLACSLGAEQFTSTEGIIGGIGSLYFAKEPSGDTYKVIGRERIERRKNMYVCVPNQESESGCRVMAKMLRLPFIKVDDYLSMMNLVKDNTAGEKDFEIHRVDNYFYIATALVCTLPDAEKVTKEEFSQAVEYAESEYKK